MGRGLPASVVTELEAPILRLEYLFEGDFQTAPLRLWTGLGDLSWSGKTWLGNGWLQEPGAFREISGRNSDGVTIELSGVPSEIISVILSDTIRTSNGAVYLAFFNDADSLIHVQPMFVGELDRVVAREDPFRPEIQISYEPKSARIRVPREERWTHEAQRAEDPTDKGFEYVTFLLQQRIYWGREDPLRVGRR